MKIFLLLITLIATIEADDCDGLCECSDSIVTCRYLSRFPSIIGRSAVTDMTLIFSDILAVPNLGVEYPRLQTLSFRQCRFVTCDLVARIKREKPGIVVDYDSTCTPPAIATTTTTTTTTTTMTTKTTSTASNVILTTPSPLEKVSTPMMQHYTSTSVLHAEMMTSEVDERIGDSTPPTPTVMVQYLKTYLYELSPVVSEI